MDEQDQKRTKKNSISDEVAIPTFRFLWLQGQWPATFRALRHRNFRLFWFGQLISLIGTWMQSVAQGWLITELTAGNAKSTSLYLGIISALGSLPMLFLTLFAGAIADRYDKRRILIITQASSLVLAFALAILTSLGIIRIWHVALLAMLLGVVNAFDMPTRQAFVKDMVGGEDLLNAIALNSSIFNGARVLGPAVAGGLIAIRSIGISGAFYINGISYIAVIIGLAMIAVPRVVNIQAEGDIWHHLREGFRYVAKQRTILTIMVIMAIYSIFGFSYMVLLPAIARLTLHVGSRGYGFMISFTGLGALISALLLATLAGKVRKGRILFIGGTVFSLGLIILSQFHQFIPYLIFLAFVGGGLVISSSSINSLIQEIAPDNLRGRIVSMW
ncbi:MAG TPA: MFS transporter, partial [Armatimonadota bacterium]|nr:MFS transporter [Armatimonadota bacterium]